MLKIFIFFELYNNGIPKIVKNLIKIQFLNTINNEHVKGIVTFNQIIHKINKINSNN